MDIVVVGAGKLAQAIINSDLSLENCNVIQWELFNEKEGSARAILVHAGSGRQLDEAIEFCRRTKSVFIELSTGLKTEHLSPDFPLIICPNTSILLLKTIKLLSLAGPYFSTEKIRIIESHQESKTSAPGTAYKIAEALNVPLGEIESVRNSDVQLNQIGIPKEFLDRHAYHKIIVGQGSEQISIETKVLGHDSYVSGIRRIIGAVLNNSLRKNDILLWI
nr:dihydrodipicolinate reductase C-terminal domain-containing protein [Pedobacter sp. SYSU D00535]